MIRIRILRSRIDPKMTASSGGGHFVSWYNKAHAKETSGGRTECGRSAARRL